VSLVRVVIICPASTHTALVSSPSLAVLHLPRGSLVYLLPSFLGCKILFGYCQHSPRANGCLAPDPALAAGELAALYSARKEGPMRARGCTVGGPGVRSLTPCLLEVRLCGRWAQSRWMMMSGDCVCERESFAVCCGERERVGLCGSLVGRGNEMTCHR